MFKRKQHKLGGGVFVARCSECKQPLGGVIDDPTHGLTIGESISEWAARGDIVEQWPRGAVVLCFHKIDCSKRLDTAPPDA